IGGQQKIFQVTSLGRLPTFAMNLGNRIFLGLTPAIARRERQLNALRPQNAKLDQTTACRSDRKPRCLSHPKARSFYPRRGHLGPVESMTFAPAAATAAESKPRRP